MSSILSTWENSNDDTIFDRAPLPRYSSQRMINLEYSPNMEPLLSRRTAFTLNVSSLTPSLYPALAKMPLVTCCDPSAVRGCRF